MTFAEKLRKARKDKKLSQSELAELVGVHYRTIQNWEKGHRKPSNFELLKKLADSLSVPADFLCSDVDILIMTAGEKGGPRAARDMEALITEVTGLFAGGELAEEDKDNLIAAFNKAYWIAKAENEKLADKGKKKT